MDARVQTAGPVDSAASGQWAAALIGHRQTVLPKRLVEPGPDASQLDLIFRAAAAAPDHGELLPWRFVVIPAPARTRLADVFASSLWERDPQATAGQFAQAREKAFRAPMLMLAVVRTGSADDEVPGCERLLSAGCAIQNMLLVATALGFASALTSGKALRSAALERLFSLQAGEQAVCFVSLGTATKRKPARLRPEPDRYISFLEATP
ncbi:MAG: nitroreductase [Pseudoxanthomonas sp.]|nr:nitroreductase [Pseudoxanthomonas sp.]